MAKRHTLRNIVAAIADGVSIDWVTVEAAAESPTERDLLQRLRSIAGIASQRPDVLASGNASVRLLHWVCAAIVILAGLKTAFAFPAGVTALLEGIVPPGRVLPPILSLAVFGLAGGALTLGGSRDLRSKRLGMFFVLIASAFADRLLAPFADRAALEVPVTIAMRLATDAFLGLALWLFVWEFPSTPRRVHDRRLNLYCLWVVGTVNMLLFATSAAPLLEQAGVPGLDRGANAIALFDRNHPSTSSYWLVLFCTLAPALPYMIWKSRFEATEERQRVSAFVLLFSAGLTPMILAVIVSPFLPFFDDPANRDGIGLFLYGSLLSIVPLTTYAVRVAHVMNIDLIITAAMRHAAIRYSVWLAGIAPIAAMTAYAYANRHLTIIQIVSARGALVLLPLLGVMALTFRHQLLRAMDRRFIGERLDHLQVLAQLKLALSQALGVRQVVAILKREVERALYADSVDVLVLDDTGRRLVSTTESVRALPLNSVLGNLIRETREEIYTGVEASAPVQRLLPEEDRRWLTDNGFQILVPLTTARGALLGVIALGEKRRRTSFSAEDRLLLSMIASYGTMILENLCLRDFPFRHLVDPAGGNVRRIDWTEEPAALCPRCRLVFPARQVACTCGSPTVAAALPLMLHGKFRVERLLGTGGMGVVYLATDIALNRRVAIKTIPSLTPQRVARLEREARAMALVVHPNLATIFDVQSWRGAPVLIVEYLEGGTLAEALAGAPLDVVKTVDLGIILADVLQQMHDANILHRDLKPSNIGYARDGAPKVMDFGVAYVLDAAHVPASASERMHSPQLPGTRPSSTERTSMAMGHVIGTPLYLSPEAAAGIPPDRSFDLWSAAITLLEASSGRHPFRADTVEQVLANVMHHEIADARELIPGCPDDLAIFFADSLSRDPRRRPPTAAEFRNRLRRVRDRMQID